jgi:hypothetical protein
LFTGFSIGGLPKPLRAQLEPEGIIFVAEKVGVRQRFSGSVPARHDAAGDNRHIGLVVFTRPDDPAKRCGRFTAVAVAGVPGVRRVRVSHARRAR